jgi:threonine/homoserine/homoserine lactone efflux protein
MTGEETFTINPYLMAGLVVYIGLCAGMIAAKHGKNPLLYGLIAVISPLNLILLGIWAFGKFEREGLKEK